MRPAVRGETAADESLHRSDGSEQHQALGETAGLLGVGGRARRTPASDGRIHVEAIEECAILDGAPPAERVGFPEAAFVRFRNGDRAIELAEIQHDAMPVDEPAPDLGVGDLDSRFGRRRGPGRPSARG